MKKHWQKVFVKLSGDDKISFIIFLYIARIPFKEVFESITMCVLIHFRVFIDFQV